MGYGSGVTVSCGVGRRHGSDPSLLWRWVRPEAAPQLQLNPLELPYAVGVAQKKQKKKKKKKKKKKRKKKYVYVKLQQHILPVPSTIHSPFLPLG